MLHSLSIDCTVLLPTPLPSRCSAIPSARQQIQRTQGHKDTTRAKDTRAKDTGAKGDRRGEMPTWVPGSPKMRDLACARLVTLTPSISLTMSPFSMRGTAWSAGPSGTTCTPQTTPHPPLPPPIAHMYLSEGCGCHDVPVCALMLPSGVGVLMVC